MSKTSAIFDIRRERDEHSILEDIHAGLRPEGGQSKTLPTLLLYDGRGLKLFEKITYLDEYYLTNTEIDVLTKWATSIAERIPDKSAIIELGSGNLRKIEILLQAIDALGREVDYYALDVSEAELRRTLAAVPHDRFRGVKCYGLHGTYDDGLEWLKSPAMAGRAKSVLSMGSSIGNFDKGSASHFLSAFAAALHPGDRLLIGIDACRDPAKVFHAYNDTDGVTHRFILNGLEHANQLLGSDEFNIDEWRVIGEYRYDADGGRHVAFVTPKRDVAIDGILVRKDEKIQIEESNKFSADEANRLFHHAGLQQGVKWTNETGDYALYMAYKPDFLFSGSPSYAANAVPSLEEWRNLWSLWSMITTDMIPKEELLAKPIKLRNACIFYIGHIPTFLDLHISKALGVFSEELGYYQKIFERGIDPDVDNPQLCHAHSEIPDDWPPVDAIRAYQEKVRQRVVALFESGEAVNNPVVRKALWLGFEHEAMHLETLLYMLVQSDRTKAPAGVVAPDFEALADDAKAVKNEWVIIPAQQFVTGLDDPDGEPSTTRYYGWDNEKPPRLVKTQPFLAKSRPITNREYAEYLENTDSPNIPAGWVEVSTPKVSNHANGYTNGRLLEDFVANKAVRTLFGRVPLRLALDWPAAASYDELAGCAAWMGGRIPTAEEAKAIYRHAERLEADVPARTETVGAVNSHLVNDGVEETPPSGHANGHAGTAGLFADLNDANVGFKAWHPVAAGPGLAGRAGMGGVWEWTSTVLEQHAGFEPMALYPGYTADFFDGKHNVVLGGSWATHPRIAGRKSFVNWYQRNYPYVWAGARLVKDVD